MNIIRTSRLRRVLDLAIGSRCGGSESYSASKVLNSKCLAAIRATYPGKTVVPALRKSLTSNWRGNRLGRSLQSRIETDQVKHRNCARAKYFQIQAVPHNPVTVCVRLIKERT